MSAIPKNCFGHREQLSRTVGPVQKAALLAAANDTGDDVAVSIADASKILGCDPSTVRELVRKGLLAGFRIGKSAHPKAIRIKLWSIREWEETYAVVPANCDAEPVKAVRSPTRVRNRADDEAAAWLKSRGA